MKVVNHAGLSLLLAVPVSVVHDPVTGVAGCLLGGVLIDSDHLLDYAVNYRIREGVKALFDAPFLRAVLSGTPLSVSRRLRSSRRRPDGPLRSLLLFHSLELWVPVISLALKGGPFLFAVAVGGVGHLISDYMTWHRPWYAFSFLYRLAVRFELDEGWRYMMKLKAAGVDIERCNDCGARGPQEVHYEPIGEDYRKGPIENFMVLCPECHDRRHDGPVHG